MDVLRTPDECFDGLVDYPFIPRYTSVDGLRIHHIEEGSSGGPPVVLLHGPPTWCYSWRKVIPVVAAAGFRVLAPDMVGFGRSDKPVVREKQTSACHVDWMASWFKELDLWGVTLVCQGLGTMIGLRLAAMMPDRFAAIVVAGGFLPTGDHPLGARFGAWDIISRFSPLYPFGWAVQTGCKRRLFAQERAAYEAPFPTTGHAFGARALTGLVPKKPDGPEAGDNKRAWSVLVSWDKPVVTAFGRRDPFFKGADQVLQQRIPGARGQEHAILDAHHFVQEDAPEELAAVVLSTAEMTRQPIAPQSGDEALA